MARPLRAALYGRASSDPKRRGRSIKDQFAVGEAECNDRGWQIFDHYEDRDRSASRRATKVRERFQQLVADVEAGHIDVIVYAERSRASRDMEVSLKLRKLCERTGTLLCYDNRVYDMRVASDRREFTRDAVQSEEEAEAIAERANRTARLNARRGSPHSGAPFGYKRSYDPDDGHLLGQDAHPEHASVLQDLFVRVDARESLRAVLKIAQKHRPDLTRAGLTVVLRNRAYLGIRVHGDDEYPGTWPALIEPALFWRVQAVLDDPSRRTNRDTHVRHLLTGIAKCGVCRAAGDYAGSGLRHRNTRATNRRPTPTPPAYRCKTNHVTVPEAILDMCVEEAVLHWISSDAAKAVFQPDSPDSELARERAKVVAMQKQLADARSKSTQFDPVTGQPGLSIASLAAIEQQVLPLLTAAESMVRKLLSIGDPLLDHLLGLPADALDDAWNDDLDMEQRRHVVRTVVRVELMRSPRMGRHQSISDRVRLLFPGEPGFADWLDHPGKPATVASATGS